MAVKHGGNLIEIANKYGSDHKEWLDLSTGVSPFTYPVGEIPLSVWNRLPEIGDGLESAAQEYYGAISEPVSVAGSQAAIMALPGVITLELGRCGTITLPRVGYKEHQHAWAEFQTNGQEWKLDFYDDFPSKQQIADSDVVLVINPNNPSGRLSQRNDLARVRQTMAAKGGYLIVDEAFADCTPEISMLNSVSDNSVTDNSVVDSRGLIVLRSVGKFFGLAGARAGFVFAEPLIKTLLQETLGPWTVTGPVRWVLKKALADSHWQKEAKQKIGTASGHLNQLLDKYISADRAGTDLFTTVYLPDAPCCHDVLCQHQVLTRLCDEKNALRFGLPADEDQRKKLEAALIKLAESRKETICD